MSDPESEEPMLIPPYPLLPQFYALAEGWGSSSSSWRSWDNSGAGGKALMRPEVPGPINEAVRPRVRETALVMWAIYMCLTAILSVIIYWLEE
ncbi:MAG: hypothetical protein R3C11_11375 [Planctomycetaceae bacterium]